MTIEDQIAALLAEAEPLRLLPDDEAESMGLPGIVEMINALRMVQESGQRDDPMKPASGLSQIVQSVDFVPLPMDPTAEQVSEAVAAKPKRGRKPKAD